MFSIKGTYENGKIKLLEPINIKEDTNVIITFLDHDIRFKHVRDVNKFRCCPGMKAFFVNYFKFFL